MANPVVTRLVKGFAAHGFGQLHVLVVQLVSYPLFTGQWGAARYGEWLTLTALPNYLNITDLSFGATAANEMTMLAGAGEEAKAERVYRSAWVLVLALCATVLLVSGALTLGLPFDRWLGLRSFTRGDAVLTMLFFIGQIVLNQQGSILSGAFRAGGFYATGVWFNDVLRTVEFVAVVGVLLAGGGPVPIAGSVFVLRAIGYLAMYAYARRLVPWLSLGFRGATMEAIRPIVAPALAYNALPLAQATTIQGSVLVVQAVAGPVAVVAFSAIRTVTRIVYQGVTLLANASWPEFSRAIGAGDLDVARRLHRRMCQIGFWSATVSALAIGALGPWLYRHWIHKAPFRPDVFAIMLVNAVLLSLWSVSYVVPLSVNRHGPLTLRYLAATLLGLVLSIALGQGLGLPGVALGLIPVDIIMIAVVLPMSLRLLEDDGGYANLVRPPFAWFYGKLRATLRARSAS